MQPGACWKMVAKSYRLKYHYRLRKIRNQQSRLRQLEESIVGVRAYNTQLKYKLEAQEEELSSLKAQLYEQEQGDYL